MKLRTTIIQMPYGGLMNLDDAANIGHFSF